ncbi:MAG: hypothetical protein JRI68_07420 [Deltaproteobacteria bacterium]|nr:hypothetical protein [Deltaproteobacteria bacterium]
MNSWRVFRCGQTVAATVLAAGLLTACDEGNGFPTTCDRPESEDPLNYKEGGIVDGVYWTSDFAVKTGESPIVDGEPLHWPGGAYYRIHHGLGEMPDWFLFYLSFEPDGLTEGKVALAAGNQVEVESIDEETITIVNGTCGSYWLIGRVGQIDAD